MRRGYDIGFEGILGGAFDRMGCVLHADEECMRDAIAWPNDLRDLSETATHGHRERAPNAPFPE
jgi:hypothetical protein